VSDEECRISCERLEDAVVNTAGTVTQLWVKGGRRARRT